MSDFVPDDSDDSDEADDTDTADFDAVAGPVQPDEAMAADGDDDRDEQEGDEDDREPLSAKIRAAIPDQPSMGEHDRSGVALVDELRDATVNVSSGLLIAGARVVPFSERFFHGLYAAGLKGIYKKSGCDYVGMIQVGGEIKPVPVNYDYEKGRFENRHGDWWQAPTEGEYRYRMAGKVPAVWASSTSNHVGSHLQAEVAEALDMGREKDLYQTANIEIKDATLTADGQRARADGGDAISEFSISGLNPGPWSDRVVPLTPSDDADARVVSLDKYYETYPSVVDTEEMQNQEDRGRLSANNRDYGKFALKMMLIAAAIIAIVVLGPPLVDALLGSGGGGGGGGGSIGGTVIPGMLGLV